MKQHESRAVSTYIHTPFFHIDGEVDHIGPTETVHLELKKFYKDFNLVTKDGSWIHFEFQSSDNKALADLKRFWAYEASSV